MNALKNKIILAVLISAVVSNFSLYRISAAPSFDTTATTIRVSPTGTDTANCGSEALPCRSIQYAVNKAVTGDIILVAGGVYKYNQSADPCTSLITRAVVCVNNKQLSILGGYSSGNWSVADPVNNLTTIDGESVRRGVAILRSNATASLTMEGFTIENGRALGNPTGNTYTGHAFGGGMYASKTFVNLKNVIFKNNMAIGGSSMSIASAGWAFGGGLSIEGPSVGGSSTLEKVTFIGNQSRGGSGSDGGGNGLGGGFMVSEAPLTATELTMTNNIAKGGDTTGNACSAPGGGYGGAISLFYHTGYIISKVTATGNQAIGSNAAGSAGCAGAGIGGVFFLEEATVSISDSHLQSNLAIGGTSKTGGIGWAGGIYTERANLNLNRTKLISNTATSGSTTGGGKAGAAGGGGALLTAFDSGNYWANITNCLFAENKAVMGSGVNGTGGGGGLLVQAITANITHSTFVNNQLENGISVGQAILVIALLGNSGKAGNVVLKYSLITDHRNNLTYNNSALQVFDGNTATLSYNWFGNNTSHTYLPSSVSQSNIWRDARSGGYVSPASPNFDYHLQNGSPVINLGTGSTTTDDLDALPRPFYNIADLGAYEYRLPPTLVADTPIYALTNTNETITRTSRVSVTMGSAVQWTATSNASWLELGPSGSSQEASGQTGTDLIMRINSSRVGLGTYQTTINISSPSAEPTTITVNLIKVDQLNNIFLPVITR